MEIGYGYDGGCSYDGADGCDYGGGSDCEGTGGCVFHFIRLQRFSLML